MVLERLPLETIYSSILGFIPPSTNVISIGIFGLNPYAFFLILFIGTGILMIFARIWWNQKQQEKHRQQAKNRVLCEFCGEGWSELILCEVFKGQIKQEVKASRTSFGIQDFIAAPKNKLKHAVSWGLDFYFWLPDHAFLVDWPEGKPAKQQIRIMKAHYYINDPMPKITYRPQEWNADVYERTTSALLKYAQDEKVAEVAVGELSGKFQLFETALRYMKQIPMMFIIQLGQCFILLVIGFLAFKAMSNGDAVIKFLIGK
jgi:hypothetical protein